MPSQPRRLFADKALKASAATWLLLCVAGQWMFAAYVLLFYGRAAADGNFAAWNKVLYRGWIAGDTAGNVAVAVHLLLAALITACGALQLVPLIRARAPTFHRWNGRFYLASALLLSIGGLFMVWTRGTVGGLVLHVSISVNALAILLCAALAWRHALARRFDVHRRWALRLFMVVSGVWFFRVGLMFWLVVNRGPAGFDPKTFQGPFLTFLGFAQFLLPLLVLELYLRVQARGRPGHKLAMAGGLAVLTLMMGVGIAAASMGMWLPRMK